MATRKKAKGTAKRKKTPGRLESGTLRLGDMIRVLGHTTDFSQKVESLEVNHALATEVGPNDDFGLKVVEHAREHDVVYKVGS
jgi:Elongation factor Tu domain 2